MNITIIGAGYVGLVTGACFAELGHKVICIDTNGEKIETLRRGGSSIFEPQLDELLQSNIRQGRLFFTTHWTESIPDAEIIFIAVGTPTARCGNGYADMNYVYEASRLLAPHLRKYAVVANKSTVPVGSTRQIEQIIHDMNPQAIFDIASAPEFLREGSAIHEFMSPDRIVIGVECIKAREVLQQAYQPFHDKKTPFLFTTLETAELIKYASNAFLATKISFINEMARLSEAVGADVQDLAKGIGLDSRIGPKFLNVGPGFGGSCFPKDTVALIRMAQEHGAPSRIIETVVEVNNAQKVWMIRKICDALEGSMTGKTLGVLGLTFKPNTDDMRESPALTILPALMERGLRVRAHDPMGYKEAKKLMPGVEYCLDIYQACENADAICLMTEWDIYRSLDLLKAKSLLKKPTFIDLRNVYQPEVMRKAGFQYISVGRKTANGTLVN